MSDELYSTRTLVFPEDEGGWGPTTITTIPDILIRSAGRSHWFFLHSARRIAQQTLEQDMKNPTVRRLPYIRVQSLTVHVKIPDKDFVPKGKPVIDHINIEE